MRTEFGGGRERDEPRPDPIQLTNLQEKIRLGMPLTAEEQLTVTRSTNDRGEPSRRRWLGMKEYPESIVDNYD